MCHPTKVEWSRRAMENGHNLNALRLLTGNGEGIKGHRLTAVNFSFKHEVVLATLKKDSPKGPMVAFMTGKDLDDCLSGVAAAVKSNQLKWKPDKWGTMRSDGS